MDEGSLDVDILVLWMTLSLAFPFISLFFPPPLSFPSLPMTVTDPSMTVTMAVLIKYSQHTKQGEENEG